MEVWKDIKGYEGLYQVSNYGNVKSLNFRHKHKEQMLKPEADRNKYLSVILYKNGNAKRICVHRIVSAAFIPNPDNLEEVNHKDENKNNNSVENLEWCTHKFNLNYGTRNKRASEMNKNSKKIICIETGLIYSSLREAERLTNIDHFSISLVCKGKQKAAGGYHWQFVEGK